jgi:penicillin amidase
LFNDKLRVSWGQPWLQRRLDAIAAEVPLTRVLAALQSRDFDWCDQRETPEKESCRDVEIDALRAAHSELQKRFGSDVSRWRWGKVQHAIFRHRPFSDVRGLDVLFERRTGRAGSPNSVNLSQFRFDDKDGYVQAVGPGFREVVQFENGVSRLFFMNSTGQSGNVMSRHYDDMVDDFSAGRYELLTAPNPRTDSTLQLLPANGGRAKNEPTR